MLYNSNSLVFFIFFRKVVGFCSNLFHMKDEDKAIYSNNRKRMYETAQGINEE
jgi:hypothetical protein